MNYQQGSYQTWSTILRRSSNRSLQSFPRNSYRTSAVEEGVYLTSTQDTSNQTTSRITGHSQSPACCQECSKNSLYVSSCICPFSDLYLLWVSVTTDQYAFRPTRSRTAALVSICPTITTMLSFNSFVIVYALDNSKAFDTVRHCTLMDKVVCLDLPGNIKVQPLVWMPI